MVDGSERYVVISCDGHDGPPDHHEKLLDYIDPLYRADYQEMLDALQGGAMTPFGGGTHKTYHNEPFRNSLANLYVTYFKTDQDLFEKAFDATYPTIPPTRDPHERVAALESQGVVADLIYPHAFASLRLGADREDPALNRAARKAYIRWLADHCNAVKGRLAGVIPINGADLDNAMEDIKWGRDHGLFGGVVLPNANSYKDFKPFVDPYWEPLWSICEDLKIPLLSHAGPGPAPDAKTAYGSDPDIAFALGQFESDMFSKRVFWHMMGAGVFDRHPGLKIGLIEHCVALIPAMIQQLDNSIQTPMMQRTRQRLKKLPSQYWYDHGFIGAAFIDSQDARRQRYQIGVENLMWGGDYPHPEGTWPHMKAAMRLGLGGLPHEELTAILGGNAARVFDYDWDQLRKAADRVGPTVSELATPMSPAEAPEYTFAKSFAPYQLKGPPLAAE